MRIASLLVSLLALAALRSAAACAGEMSARTDSARLALRADGRGAGLTETATRREWVETGTVPLMTIREGGREHALSQLTRDGRDIVARFGESAATIRLRLEARRAYLVLRIVEVLGDGVDQVEFVRLRTRIAGQVGSIRTVNWNERFAICLVGLGEGVETRVEGGLLIAVAHREYGLDGAAVALVACPPAALLGAIREL